ncbi:Glutamyl-tRNA(Gln) amidotransferase subunit A [Candidatus Phycorickettsia trachydisci]|uniref:Glutamyl-tRNA(Gln) amidotransferase subunit A n=1 Tax=Candidatus Phycorickettsia trachydisci TaxID=2115978 RepID=A0A2P1P825_9RICK|nr:Asp-tRNA(Asn)/Glu-tRNA(Gln) amidotransferase subunit GatA [Candidatus Phycorickettsia trachydisci]AVP87422.1 Glutamyl-tRNA(Gln) amidotransferase subunit A [Candidatus Phycorickettsia trachydisci]
MSDLHKLTIKEAISGLKSKKFSSLELTKAHLAQMEKYKRLNAFVEENAERALESAKESDNNIKNGTFRKLEGIPLSIKDLFCTKGIRTTACSKMLSNFVPTYESTVSGKVLNAGAVMLGKNNCDEFAMGSGNITSYFGPCINPWSFNVNKDLVPGGSSGGSATAVAGFMSMASLGTDTGGSVRQPASYTGTVGIKPTYGRCSRFGMIAFASSLDQAGILARNVYDAAYVLEVMMGFCEKDSTSIKKDVPDLLTPQTKSVKGLKIGLPVNLLKKEGLDPQILDMWLKSADILKSQGAELVDINLDYIDHSLAVYYIVACAEASSNLARYDGIRYGFTHFDEDLNNMYELTRSEGFGQEVKRRIMLGTYVLSAGFMDAYYRKAQQVRKCIYNDFMNAFKNVDSILIPTAPTEAFATDYKETNPVLMYLNDIFTVPASLAGLPAMSIPAALSKNGLPLGMQIIGKPFDEEMIVRVAAELERGININFIPKGF